MAFLEPLLQIRRRAVSKFHLPRLPSSRNGWWCIPLLLLNSLAWSATVTSEYQLKAVFLFNFTQFVDWPTQSFADASSPLIIGVLGSDPFGSFLDDTVRDEMVNGRRLTVERYKSADEAQRCHVLFISRSEAPHLPEILGALKTKSILTVSDADDFNRDGGIIRFTTVANKIRLRIAPEAAKTANLVISSKLLRPADLVASGAE